MSAKSTAGSDGPHITAAPEATSFVASLRRLLGSSAVKMVSLNSAAQAVEQLINITLGLVVTVYMARALGPELFGLWSFCVALFRIAMTCVGYGLDVFILQRCSTGTDCHERFVTAAIGVRLANAVALVAAGAVSLAMLPDLNFQAGELIMIMLPALMLVPFEAVEFFFRARNDGVTPAVARSIAVVIGSAIKIGAIAYGSSLALAGLGHAVQMGLLGVLLLIIYLVRGHRLSLDRAIIPQAKELYRMAWPLLVTQIGFLIYTRTDIIMLSWLRGDHEAGVFASATRISETANIAPVILMTAASPFIFAQFRSNPKLFARHFHSILTLLLLASALGATVVALAAPWLITTLFGETYAGASAILAIHIFGIVFVTQGVASEYWWIARRRARFSMWRTIAGATANVLLNLALIPLYGGVGAAIATVISTFIAAVGVHFMLGRNGRHLARMQLLPRIRLPQAAAASAQHR